MKLPLTVFLLFLVQVIQARGEPEIKRLDSLGSDFIISFLRNMGDKSIYSDDTIVELHMTAPIEFGEGLDVDVEYPVGKFLKTVGVFPGNITIVDLPSQASLGWTENAIQENSVRVFANKPKGDFVVYMVNYQKRTSDAALALPIDALNTKYVITDYISPAGYRPEFVVTAAYNDTIVTITPTLRIGNKVVPFNVSLGRGESFYAVGPSRSSYTGTKIRATRPVAVTNGVRCANVPVGVNYCDHIFEFAQPLQSWGNRFAAAPLPQRSGGSLYRMVAAEDNTTVTFFSDSNDTPGKVTLDSGGYFEAVLKGAVYAESDKPAFMVQFMTSDENPGAVGGDPAMGNVISIDQYLNNYTFSTLGNKYDVNYVSIVAHATDLDTISLDGNPVGAEKFSAIGETGWYSAVVEISVGTHTTSSLLEGHGITVEGFLEADSYLYPGGSQFDVINQAGDTENPNCLVRQADLYPETTTIFLEAEDFGSGIFSVDLNTLSDSVLLEVPRSFSPGDNNVKFTVSFGDVASVRDIYATAVDGAGNRCNFPTIGDILPTSKPSLQPSDAPTAKPTLQPSAKPTAIPSTEPKPTLPPDTELPGCALHSVEEGSKISFQATDYGSGIATVSLNRPSVEAVLQVHPSFSRGDTVANFSISIVDPSPGIRDIYAIATDNAGNKCTFASLGEILDQACIEDVDCVGDPGFIIPLPANSSASRSAERTIKVLSQPSFGTLEFKETYVQYSPEWSGIEYDAFAISGKTPYGDSFTLVAEYVGKNSTPNVTMKIVGQASDYFWELEELEDYVLNDDNIPRRLQEYKSTRTPQAHHELPQRLFVDTYDSKGNLLPKLFDIPGVDKDFINSPEFLVILKAEDHHPNRDHRVKYNLIKPRDYNELFKQEMKNFQDRNNGRLPNKNELINDVLRNVQADPRVDNLNKRGIRSDLNYDQWNEKKFRPIKEQIIQELDVHVKNLSVDLAESKPRKATKLAKKASKYFPVVNVLVFGGSVGSSLWSGESLADALSQELIDSIPVYSELKMLEDFGLLEKVRIKFDSDQLEEEGWNRLKRFFGFGSGKDKNEFCYASAFLDPHFKMWDDTRYDYHGACDMIFLRTPAIEIHIRTRWMGGWSGIVGAAVRIGGDVIEFSDGKQYLNGTEATIIPATVGDSFPLSISSGGFKIRLSGGQLIQVRNGVDGERWQVVEIAGHGSNFFNSSGMAGTWTKPGFVGRDGVSMFEDPSSFAKEWEVNITRGDSRLFRTEAPHNCGQSPPPILEATPDRTQFAEIACGYIEENELKNACIFDVATTGDASFAEDSIYAQPWEEPRQCNATTDECSVRGGTCVWRCDTEETMCESSLCELSAENEVFDADQIASSVVEGCSCAIPYAPPTAAPSTSPSSMPSVPSDTPTFEPTDLPSLVPSDTPSFKTGGTPFSKPSLPPVCSGAKKLSLFGAKAALWVLVSSLLI